MRKTKRLFFFIEVIPLNIQFEKLKIYKTYIQHLYQFELILFSFAFLYFLICNRRAFPLDLSFRWISVILHIFLSYPEKFQSTAAFRLLFGISARFVVVETTSFTKARISEKNDWRDERRSQIYVSHEPRDNKYFECTMFSVCWSFCIARNSLVEI